MKKGLILAAFHMLLILTIGAKFAYERQTLPHGWMRTMPVDPNTPLRGRYVSMRVIARKDAGNVIPANSYGRRVLLSVRDGEVWARNTDSANGEMIREDQNGAELLEPVSYFIPEHVPDPSRLKPGEELWVEVTIAPTGPPRPIRLEVRNSSKP